MTIRGVFHPTALAVGSLLVLPSCQSPRVDWSRVGATDADYQRDWQECGAAARGFNPPVYDARIMTAPPDGQGVAQQQNACMFARGWQLLPRP
jgi:hypothetical protein